MSKTLRGSNLQIKSYQRFKCVHCDILTVSIRCYEFFSRFFGCLRLPKLFHRYSLYCVSLKTLLFAMVKVDQWSLLYKVLNGSWVKMKLIRSNHWHYDAKNLAGDGFDNLDQKFCKRRPPAWRRRTLQVGGGTKWKKSTFWSTPSEFYCHSNI